MMLAGYAGVDPCWNDLHGLYDHAGNDFMKAVVAGVHHVPVRKLAQVRSVSDFRALLCNRTAPLPTERDARVDELAAEMAALRLKRDARVDELAAEMAALRLKREAREADLAAKNRANEAARRPRRAGRRASRPPNPRARARQGEVAHGSVAAHAARCRECGPRRGQARGEQGRGRGPRQGAARPGGRASGRARGARAVRSHRPRHPARVSAAP